MGTLERSPSTARLIVVGSAEFLNDNVLNLSASFSGDRYLNSLQFVLNSIAWFTEDAQLAAIRARSTSVRLLDPLSENEQSTWEFANYGVALLALSGLGVIWRLRKRAESQWTWVSTYRKKNRQPAHPMTFSLRSRSMIQQLAKETSDEPHKPTSSRCAGSSGYPGLGPAGFPRR
ncbi:hypothetical protein HC928_09490 [bacterium]|nr:hypothetical protein [bacterium]